MSGVDGLPAWAARTDVGRIRTGNEDRYAAVVPLFAVADGMGGHEGGEVASAIVADALESAASPDSDGTALADAVMRANDAIRSTTHKRPELAGMGTTCTALLVSDRRLSVVHVGDSRAYRFRHGRLEQLTDDHSLVAGLVRDGLLTEEQAAADDRRHIVTRALGVGDEVHLDRLEVDLEPGDRLLVCSDGLSGQVDDPTIAAILAAEPDPGRAADRLVELANAAGGIDNVTVVIVDPDRLPLAALAAVPAGPATRERPRGRAPDLPARRRRLEVRSGAAASHGRRSRRPVLVLAVLVAAALIAAAWALGLIGGGSGGTDVRPAAPASPATTPVAVSASPALPVPASASPATTPVPASAPARATQVPAP